MATKPQKEMQQLGHSLRSLREDFGLSMHEVARRANFTPSYISKLEQGGVFQTVTIQALKSFSDVYHIPVQVLIEKAGFIEEEEGLPGLSAYLKAKYHVSHRAAQEMEFAWEIVQKKYLLQKHRQP